MSAPVTFRRDALFQALNGDRSLVAAFEQQAETITEVQQVAQSNLQGTEAIQEATVLTLSPNASFTNERILRMGQGVRMVDDGTYLTISANDEVPEVQGGFQVILSAQSDTIVVLPESGTLATRSNPETLTNKTLAAPRLSSVPDYADDAAAAAGGVAVGQIYRSGSNLKVRAA